jgi:superfamily II DNA/RNA helicase
VQNVVFQARAGTGKTVAFVINAIARCNPAWGHVQACIVSPTVVLNAQTAKVVEELAQGTGIRVAAAIDRNDPEYSLHAPITAQILCVTPGTLLGWCRASRGKRFIPSPEKIQVCFAISIRPRTVQWVHTVDPRALRIR